MKEKLSPSGIPLHDSTIRSVRFNIWRLAIISPIIIFSELYQNRFDQKMNKCMIDIVALISVHIYYDSYRYFSKIIDSFIYVYLIAETASWVLTRNGICYQVLVVATDFAYIYYVRPIVIVLVAIALAFIVALANVPVPKKYYSIPINRIVGFLLIAVSLFVYIKMNWSIFQPIDNTPFSKPDNPLLASYFGTKFHVTPPKNPKNLFLIHIECMEKQVIGIFNKYYPKVMPWLSNFLLNGTILTNLTMVGTEDFTVASIFTQHTNMPFISAHYKRGNIYTTPDIFAVGDYLHAAGYKVDSYCTALCSLFKFFRSHHYTYHDYRNNFKNWDDYHSIQELVNKTLPNLAKETKPWMFFFMNEGTHPQFTIEKECLPMLNEEQKSYPRALQAFSCFDYYIKMLFDKFFELGLDKTTEVIIYGDHQLYGYWSFLPEPRQLLVAFPLQKQQNISKPTRMYDMAPTMLHLAGITDYQPKFPFGRNVFSDEVTVMPTVNDKHFLNFAANH